MTRYTEKAMQLSESTQMRREQAFNVIPEAYHSFIVMMAEQECIGAANELSKDEIDAGIMLQDGKAYCSVSKPYMMVDGRVKWARDEHKQNEKKLFIHPPAISEDGTFLTVHVESEWLGSSSGSSTIPVGNQGFAATSAIEMAQTSALGRALGFLGYGLIGGGFITAEEKQSKDQSTSMINKKTNDSTEDDLDLVKFRVEENPQINADSTCFVKGMLQDRTFVDVLFPKALLSDARKLTINDVICILGYRHDAVIRVQRFATTEGQQVQTA
ncbi:hypothetical protein [Alkalihalophilus marmarensis]|uniref:hypothetical protein n=1 Tax=Alkalihalophilus marmarensis TaxID=521377 RepID=UPI002DBD5351|nr:hypothetical protein [Alkalihalophilus marmarensis]MEC2074188.1 hypothetical protein [Alkalihalophilus marmarensis]